MAKRRIRALSESDLTAIGRILEEHTTRGYATEELALIRKRHTDPSFIAIACEDRTGIVGFATGIVYGEDTGTDEFRISRPEEVTCSARPLLLLKHVYVADKWRGNGIGRQLSEQVLDEAVESHAVTAAFGESWIQANYRSSEELFESLGFEQVFHDDDYYEEANAENPDVTCKGCDNRQRNCNCAGAIYLKHLG